MQEQLHEHTRCGNLDEIKNLINLGVDFCTNNNYAISVASEYGHLDVMLSNIMSV